MGQQEQRLDLTRDVQNVFSEIDRATTRYGKDLQIACPKGCGQCCQNPHIETTVADMLPAAAEFLRLGEAAEVYERAGKQKACLFFEQNAEGGRCGRYAQRPSICRLFAFAPRKTRAGTLEHVTCCVQKERDPPLMERAASILNDKREPYLDYQQAGSMMAQLHPTLGTQLLPLNEALRQALGWLSLQETPGRNALPGKVLEVQGSTTSDFHENMRS